MLIQSATMLLRAAAIVSPAIDASSPWKKQQQHNGLCKKGISTYKCDVVVGASWYMKSKRGVGKHCVRAAVGGQGNLTTDLSGVIFEPFVEVQDELSQVSLSFSKSLARQKFLDGCEVALNDQINNVEYNVSYIYHALIAYFDRDNIALPGFAKYFKDANDDEWDDAEKLMKYQNIRGGKVNLHSVLMPAIMEFDDAQKGDAFYAMELALSLEKLTNQKLLNLHTVAQEANDGQMTDFIEGNFLTEQVETINKISRVCVSIEKDRKRTRCMAL